MANESTTTEYKYIINEYGLTPWSEDYKKFIKSEPTDYSKLLRNLTDEIMRRRGMNGLSTDEFTRQCCFRSVVSVVSTCRSYDDYADRVAKHCWCMDGGYDILAKGPPNNQNLADRL